MFFTTRLAVFTAAAVAGVLAWHWTSAAPEVTELAIQQFQNDATVPTELQQAALAQNWWPLIWPALIVVVGIVLFWEDFERLWKREEE